MSEVAAVLAGLLAVVGALFTLTAAIGLLRLPDLFTRMHAASKAGTVGSCAMLIALAIEAGDAAVAARALAGVVFFLMTAPVAAHLLARAALSAGYRPWKRQRSRESRRAQVAAEGKFSANVATKRPGKRSL